MTIRFRSLFLVMSQSVALYREGAIRVLRRLTFALLGLLTPLTVFAAPPETSPNNRPNQAQTSPDRPGLNRQSGPRPGVVDPARDDTPPPPIPSPAGKPPGTVTVDTRTPSGAIVAGETLPLADWAAVEQLVALSTGKVVVVDIWSTSCEPCMQEFPHLVALQKNHPDDVVTIAFATDYVGIKSKPPKFYRERILKFLTDQHAEQVVNLQSSVAAEELFGELKLDSIPAVFVYGRDGKLRERFDNRNVLAGQEGVSYERQVAPLVEQLVRELPAAAENPSP